MQELMIELFNNKMSFIFDGVDIIVGTYNTGFYGAVDTVVSYLKDSKEYNVDYGTKGYPYSKCFSSIEELISFIKEIHY